MVSIMIFYVGFIAYSDFDKFSLNLSQLKLSYIFPLVILGFVSMVIKGLRQHILLKKINVNLSLKNSLLLFFAGLSMIVTPGGSGELIKSYFLKKKYGYDMRRTFPIVFVERFNDLLAMVSIIAFSLAFFNIKDVAILLVIIGFILAFLYVIIRIQKLFSQTTRFLAKIPKLNRFISDMTESYDAFYLLTSKNIIIKSWLISIAAWSFDAVVIYLIFIAFGLDFNIVYTTIISFTSILFGSISLLPAGIGLTELTLVGFLADKGVELSLATSIVIMMRIVGIWYATLLGFITTKFFLSNKNSK